MVVGRWLVVFGVVSVVLVGASAGTPSDELKKLEGTWLVTSATLNGKAMDDMKDGQVTITGEKLTIKGKDGKDQKFTVKVDPTKKPKTMDLAFVVPVPNAAPGQVIYELDGDALKLVIGPPDQRPTDFTDKGQVLVSLKRKK